MDSSCNTCGRDLSGIEDPVNFCPNCGTFLAPSGEYSEDGIPSELLKIAREWGKTPDNTEQFCLDILGMVPRIARCLARAEMTPEEVITADYRMIKRKIRGKYIHFGKKSFLSLDKSRREWPNQNK